MTSPPFLFLPPGILCHRLLTDLPAYLSVYDAGLGHECQLIRERSLHVLQLQVKHVLVSRGKATDDDVSSSKRGKKKEGASSQKDADVSHNVIRKGERRLIKILI